MGFFDRLFPKKPPKEALTLGRNEPCWCGSGVKYKRCHFDADQEYLSKLLAAKCKTSS